MVAKAFLPNVIDRNIIDMGENVIASPTGQLLASVVCAYTSLG